MAILEKELNKPTRRRVNRKDCRNTNEWIERRREERELDMEEVRNFTANGDLNSLVEIVNDKKTFDQHVRWAALEAAIVLVGEDIHAIPGLAVNRFTKKHADRLNVSTEALVTIVNCQEGDRARWAALEQLLVSYGTVESIPGLEHDNFVEKFATRREKRESETAGESHKVMC